MASWAELKRAGADGFAIIEEHMLRPSTKQRASVQIHGCLYQHHPNQSVELYMKPVSAAEKMTNCFEVVQFRDAMPVMDYSKRKSRVMGY